MCFNCHKHGTVVSLQILFQFVQHTKLATENSPQQELYLFLFELLYISTHMFSLFSSLIGTSGCERHREARQDRG